MSTDAEKTWLQPATLQHGWAILVPLSHDHCDDLAEAVRDGELWTLWYTNVPTAEEMDAEIDRRLDLQRAGSMLPFTIIDKDSGKPVGMTTYMDADARTRRVEIGCTWYRKSV